MLISNCNYIDNQKHGFEPLAAMPAISPDGTYLFFRKGCRVEPDIVHSNTFRYIWWVVKKVIEKLNK